MFKLIIVAVVIVAVAGHGTVHDPPARQTRWRYDTSAPANTNDAALNCGNYNTHYIENGGRCGLCGDNYAELTPRSHELGGRFGQGVIVRSYNPGSLMYVNVRITQNHKGHFIFDLCNLDRNGGTESQECFGQTRLRMADGSDRYVLESTANGWYDMHVQIPAGVTCNHCVLRWTYVAANRWGTCEDGSGALGCGQQENFFACSDISIN